MNLSWTDLYVVKRVKFHKIMQLSESLIGILEVECGVGRLRVIEDVKVCKISLFVCFTWNTFKINHTFV